MNRGFLDRLILIVLIAILLLLLFTTYTNKISIESVLDIDNTFIYLFTQANWYLVYDPDPVITKAKVEATLNHVTDLYSYKYKNNVESNIVKQAPSLSRSLAHDFQRLNIYEQSMEVREKVFLYLAEKISKDEIWSSMDIEKLVIE